MTPYTINRNYRYYAILLIFLMCLALYPQIKAAATHFTAIPSQAVESISALALMAAIWWLFGNFLWKLPSCIGIPFVPDLSGRWVGYIEQRLSHDSAESSDIARKSIHVEIPVEMKIEQSFADISIALRSFEDGLGSAMALQDVKAAALDVNQPTIPRLFYVFSRGPLQGETTLERRKVGKHYELRGEYTSNHPRRGRMRLELVKSKKVTWSVGRMSIQVSQTGERYLGISVAAGDVMPFLEIFKRHVGPERFQKLRRKQVERDGPGFHITVLTPSELASKSSELTEVQNWDRVGLGSLVWFRLEGVGHARSTDSEDECFYIIGASRVANSFRHKIGLPDKQLHVTIGFFDNDVHGLDKGPDTKIRAKRLLSGWKFG